MLRCIVLLLVVSIVLCENVCYWNSQCPFHLYSSKTPYDVIRGDIRDRISPKNCEAVSLWSLHRHGNRNPGSGVTQDMNELQARIKDEIISSYDAGRSQLCAQDIEDFRNWKWNVTLEESISFLTGVGYEELYDIGKRIRQKYPHILGNEAKMYFRPTNEQRTVTSAVAFIHGLKEGTDLNITIDGPFERDDVLRPYENCEKYQQEVKHGPTLAKELKDYDTSPEYLAVRDRVQKRLGLTSQLSVGDIYNLYELCRFYRSWNSKLQSPWCAAFTDRDLVVLEYRDDVRHYYRNGYGSLVNVNLGTTALKDMYEKLEAAVRGVGMNVVSYFTHDTMLEMTYCAMNLFKDLEPIRGSNRSGNRKWRTSEMAAFSTNIIAVLHRCQEADSQIHRVQLFVNEKPSTICPEEGCTWQRFQEGFKIFNSSNLDFCVLNRSDCQTNSAVNLRIWMSTLVLISALIFL